MRVGKVVLLFVTLLLASRAALAAEQRDPVAAEALFAAGMSLMDAGKLDEACPKLEESYRLDPATGALYALALCHERQGKLATAWAEFLDAAARSNAERNTAREQAAREHAEALEPRLSFLIVRVDTTTAKLPGLSITRNGVPLRPAGWGTPVPIDPGTHRLRAVAPGYEPWETMIDIAASRQREVVEVPALVESRTPAAPPPSPPATKPPAWLELTPLEFAGVALGAGGAASLGIAAFAMIRALDKNADSNANGKCDPVTDVCNVEGERDRMAAREAANFATIGAIAGGALLGAGIVLFVVGGDEASPNERAAVTATVTAGSLRLKGAF